MTRVSLAPAALAAFATLASACAGSGVPDPKAAADAYARAAERGDADAIYSMMTASAQKERSRDEVRAIVKDERTELAEEARALGAKDARVDATARLRFADGEEAALDLADGAFAVTSAGALPGGARTPEEALDQLRRVLARRSYAGLMRVISPSTRAAIEQDLRALVTGLDHPETLPLTLAGDTATIAVPGGHHVRLKRESGVWRVDDLIDLRRSLFWLGATIGAALLVIAIPRPARAFGERSAFDPRVLLAGGTTAAAHLTAPSRWSWELQQRTSAPARLTPSSVRADDPAIVDAPFVYWSGDQAISELTPGEVSGLRRFFALGGMMVVDDAAAGSDGTPSPFGRSTRRQLERVLPDATTITLGIKHVLYHSFYLLNRAEGRVLGPPLVNAIVRGGEAQVIFTENDLGGALARGGSGIWEAPVVPGGELQREHAIRLAVNIAMYVLCTNYKDDQVHAPFLMRRRAHASLPEGP